MNEFNFLIEREEAGVRLDVFLAQELQGETGLSRSGIKRLIEDGRIYVNKKTVKAGFALRPGDQIQIVVPEAQEIQARPEEIPLDVVYEDRDLLVVNKPQGMVVHLSPGHYSGTLVNALLFHCKEGLSGINGDLRPGIVHRIDKDTSGLLVVAKTNMAHQLLSQQLAEHSMTRVYKAIATGVIKEDTYINAPIGRHPTDRKKMAVSNKNSRRALTHVRVLERFQKFTYMEAILETGRTHQIRVHLSHIHHPILGDTIYGSEKQPFGLSKQVLHAQTLGFVHPKGDYMEFEAPLPAEFTEVLEKLRKGK